MQHKDFSEKVVLIPGGTGSIGYAAARAFILNGAKVVLAGRRVQEGKAAEEELGRITDDVLFVQADVSDEEQVVRLLDKTIERFGRIDIAFNNAGIKGTSRMVEEITEQQFNAVMNGNLKSTWLCCKHEILAFKQQQSKGVIINTSSWLSKATYVGSAMYAASKAAIDSLTRSMAVENAPIGIRINNINPGYIASAAMEGILQRSSEEEQMTHHIPYKRPGKAQEVAELVLWLASGSCSYLTGQTIFIDGGLSIAGQNL